MRLKIVIVFLLASAISFWDWVSLAYHAFGYPISDTGAATNVVLHGDYAYTGLAEQGLGVYKISTQQQILSLPPPTGSGSIDDVAVADGWLFGLDARTPGTLSVYSLQDPARPRLASGPIAAEVGPFSGVSAAGGKVIVSGGTSLLSLRSYDREGRLGTGVVTADLGRGQPDILLSPEGERAVVSSHFSGPDFGLTTLDLTASQLQPSGTLKLERAGFTEGGAKPANFPLEAAWSSERLLLAHGGGLAFIDLKKFASPRVQQIIEVGVTPVNVDVRGPMAAVVGSHPDPRLVLIDIQSLEYPQVVRSIDLPAHISATGVAVGPTHIVVAAGEQGLLFFQR